MHVQRLKTASLIEVQNRAESGIGLTRRVQMWSWSDALTLEDRDEHTTTGVTSRANSTPSSEASSETDSSSNDLWHVIIKIPPREPTGSRIVRSTCGLARFRQLWSQQIPRQMPLDLSGYTRAAHPHVCCLNWDHRTEVIYNPAILRCVHAGGAMMHRLQILPLGYQWIGVSNVPFRSG